MQYNDRIVALLELSPAALKLADRDEWIAGVVASAPTVEPWWSQPTPSDSIKDANAPLTASSKWKSSHLKALRVIELGEEISFDYNENYREKDELLEED